MIRTLLCSFALFGFATAASAGELDQDVARKAVPTQVAAAPNATANGTELDRESPQAAYRGHGGWGYGHNHGYGGHGYGYGGGYRPYYGGRAYSSYGGFGGGYGGGYYGGGGYGSFNVGFYAPSYSSYYGSYSSYGFAPYGCNNSYWY